ncbi:facilitated trehalose transporter Tret1-like [Achroia grisella]|uniref:facilitated trehalose transporter Tret1-like n=1 Tax=Achroia grisella TaxID=688607 RepID=UPI0027D20242|nr:facilitated trehalose transporter Tret1-like [Achroia grisella]
MAFPSVLILSILSTTADIKGTQDDASWLGACNAITGLIGFFVLSPIMQKFGRKSTNILVNIIVAAGWITFSFATSITTLFIGRLIHGICFGAVHINAIMISEYTDAKRRGYFGAIKKFSVSLGVLCCHSLALCWTWKQISIFAILPALIVIILTWFWPESPSFLALKGRFEDCKESFYWINGNSVEKENELTVLIASQSQRIEKKKRKQANVLNVLFQALSQRNFLNSLFTATVLTLSSDASETKDKTLQTIEDEIGQVKRTPIETSVMLDLFV